MKKARFAITFLIGMSAVFCLHAQTNEQMKDFTKAQRMGHVPSYTGTIIPMKNISVLPVDAAAPGNEIDKITDGMNMGEGTEFHTPWGGMAEQNITIEAELEGNGRTLDEIILDQRFLGMGGLIKKATLWVMKKGKYIKVADLMPDERNGRITITLKKKIVNPEKVKLLITETTTDNGNFMVCLGELACLTKSKEKPKMAKVTFIPNYYDQMRENRKPTLILKKTVPSYDGTVITMNNFKVFPENCAALGNEVDKIADGTNAGDYTEFHTPWGGMPQQDVTIEADLDGKGKRLDEIVIDQRHLGFGGIISKASLWVMKNGKYKKVADINTEIRNGRLCIVPTKKIKNPEKIKLIITDTFSDNGNYLVCVGELACIMK